MKLLKQLNNVITALTVDDCLYTRSYITPNTDYLLIPILDLEDFCLLRVNFNKGEICIDNILTLKFSSLTLDSYKKLFFLYEEAKVMSIVNLCLGNC